MRELDNVLAKKQQLIDDAAYIPASGRHDSTQGNRENLYHWTECHYEKIRVDWLKLRLNTKEYWTYTPHFRAKLYEGDLTEANADITQTLNNCLNVITRLETVMTNVENACLASNKDVARVHILQTQNEQNHTALRSVKEQTTQHLTSMTDIQRSCVLGDKYGAPGALYLEKEIERLGFHPEIAASLGILKQNIKLIDFSIKYGINFDTNLVGDKTFLQLAVETCNSEVIKKILAATPSCETSLLYALSQNDISTVKAVLSYYPNMSKLLIFGELTPLQYAVGNNSYEVANYIVNTHADSIQTKNANGDSVLKIALRSGDDKTVSIVSNFCDITAECTSLLRSNEQHLIQRAVSLDLISTNWLSSQQSTALGDNEHKDSASLVGDTSHVDSSIEN